MLTTCTRVWPREGGEEAEAPWRVPQNRTLQDPVPAAAAGPQSARAFQFQTWGEGAWWCGGGGVGTTGSACVSTGGGVAGAEELLPG